jgi:hypothetical protein
LPIHPLVTVAPLPLSFQSLSTSDRFNPQVE